MTYLLSLLEGGYPEGCVATVACDMGYTGGGDIICQRGSWTESLPECTRKYKVKVIYISCRLSSMCTGAIVILVPRPQCRGRIYGLVQIFCGLRTNLMVKVYKTFSKNV